MSELTGISQRPTFISLILILLTAGLGFIIIGPALGILFAMPYYEGTILDFTQKLSNSTEYPELRLPVLIMQGCATFFGLIIIPGLYLFGIEKQNPIDWIKSKSSSLLILLVVAILTITFFAPNSIFIEWNANFVFPEVLKEFGSWARERENLAEEFTKFFVTFETNTDFLIGLVVIAVLPAIGEELVFRGMLQPELFRATGNHHAAIWISAIIFSAFHMQFFGFVPRMLLGALFGYLYVWSGNLFLSMFAHFINNGFSVLMMYLYQRGIITVDLESPEAAPLTAVVIFTSIFIALLYYFKKYHESINQPSA
jgi:uncharacterized protein